MNERKKLGKNIFVNLSKSIVNIKLYLIIIS